MLMKNVASWNSLALAQLKLGRKGKINLLELIRIVQTLLNSWAKNSDHKLTLLCQIRVVMITDYTLFRI